MRIRQTRAMAENDKLRRYLVVTDHALDDQQLAATVQPSLTAGLCQGLPARAGHPRRHQGPLPVGRGGREVLARRPADEIILATAPHRTTRLLAMDLQHRAHRSFGLPVTVLGTARTDN